MKALFVGLMAMMATVSIYGDEASNLVELSTNYGNIVIELNKKEAPKTVKNFLSYVNKGYYDDTIFHRVIDGFMIQGGGFTEDMVQKETDKPIKNESKNGLSNVAGTIAMARTQDPNSATSQFFINVANNVYLNYKSKSNPGYCVFGRVVEGMNVVQQIKQVKTTAYQYYQNVPVDPVIIKRARTIAISELKINQKKPAVATDNALPMQDISN